MTFELLEAIIAKNKIPKNVRLVNNSENDLCTTDMNGIQYCEKKMKSVLWKRMHT